MRVCLSTHKQFLPSLSIFLPNNQKTFPQQSQNFIFNIYLVILCSTLGIKNLTFVKTPCILKIGTDGTVGTDGRAGTDRIVGISRII